MEKTKTAGLTAREMALCALFAALMAICAWISVPTTVPFTLQTFAVFLAVGMLGGRLGSLSVAVYLLLGAVGLPVFNHFTGGVGALLGSTGGYLVGFLASALVVWALEGLTRGRTWALGLAMGAGLLACYALGTLWFMVVYTAQNGPVTLATVLGWCVLPFVPFDVLKIVLALEVSRRMKGILKLNL